MYPNRVVKLLEASPVHPTSHIFWQFVECVVQPAVFEVRGLNQELVDDEEHQDECLIEDEEVPVSQKRSDTSCQVHAQEDEDQCLRHRVEERAW